MARLTSSGSGASPFAASSADSKEIALPTAGSPKMRAKTSASRPATTPDSMPRTKSILMVGGR